MHLRTAVFASLAVASLAIADGPAERKVLADFESLGANDPVATGAGPDAKPWRRFGEATGDNIVAVQGEGIVLAGKTSAAYPVAWPHRFGAAVLNADEPIDLAAFATAEITIRSDEAKTKTQVLLSIGDGKTTFTSRKARPLTDKAQTLKFTLDAAEFEFVDGQRAAFKDVLAKAKMIGFKLTSDGSTYSERVYFDDLAVSK